MSESYETIRLGAAQVAEVYMDREATVEKDCEYIEEAGEKGIDLLVFPEFHIPASPHWFIRAREIDSASFSADFQEYYKDLFENAVTVPGPAVDRLCEAAREAETAVVMGINEKVAGTGGTLYNSLVFIDRDGTLLGVRRKLVPTVHERLFHTGGSGQDVTTFDSALGTLGGLMCSEHTNHLACYAMMADQQAIHAAAWPAFTHNREWREHVAVDLTKHHAYVGGVATASASGVITDELLADLGDPDLDTDSGTSTIISPNGEILAGPKWEGEGIIFADVDMGDRVRSQAYHDITGHYNRFDIFRLLIDRSPQEPIEEVSSPSFEHVDMSSEIGENVE